MNISRINPRRVGPSTLTTSAVTYFTADKRYAIERFLLTNYSALDVAATIHVVASGGSASDSNKVLGELNIVANDHTVVPLPIILEVGEKIMALAASGSSINLVFNVNDVETNLQ